MSPAVTDALAELDAMQRDAVRRFLLLGTDEKAIAAFDADLIERGKAWRQRHARLWREIVSARPSLGG